MKPSDFPGIPPRGDEHVEFDRYVLQQQQQQLLLLLLLLL